MEIEYRKANTEDAELLVDIYNAAFYSDYIRYGECPGYGKTKEAMTKSILNSPKFVILEGIMYADWYKTLFELAIQLFDTRVYAY